MRRKQFIQLVYDLRAELSRAVDPAAGVADLPSLKQTISRNYETIYDDYDWPHLSIFSSRAAINAGQRYYDFPANMSYDTIDEAVVWWSGQPVPLERGIGFDNYADSDPEADDRRDPATHWDVRFTGTREQIELWPLPASAGQMQFKGKKKFVPLIDDNDICLLDDHLVVLTSAVELLPRQKSGDAQIKLAALRGRYDRVKGRSKGAGKSYRIGMGSGSSTGGAPSRATIRVGR